MNPGAETLSREEVRYFFFFFVAFLTAFFTAFLTAFFFAAMLCTSSLLDAARQIIHRARAISRRDSQIDCACLRNEVQIRRKEMTPTDRLSGFGSGLATKSDSVERVPRGRNEQ